MIVFAGTYVEVLKELHTTLKVDLVILENKPSNKQALSLTRKRQIDYVVINSPVDLDKAWPKNVDLGVVASFGQIIKSPILNRTREIINFHPGIIQTNRGRHPLPWAIKKGHTHMGITCHKIESEAIDAGSIVAQTIVPIDYDQDYNTNDRRLRKMLQPLANQIFMNYNSNEKLSGLGWKPVKETYFPPMTPNKIKTIMSAKTLNKYEKNSD